MSELTCIALILIRVIEESITHAHHALITLTSFNLVPKLLEPHPVVRVLRADDPICQQLVHHVNIVQDVDD